MAEADKKFELDPKDHLVRNEKMDTFKLVIALMMEFIGTMLFQFFGGAPELSYDGINGGIMNGVLLMVIVYMTAEWSGGHVNPAVTLGLLVSGNVKGGIVVALLYMVAQFTGALVGAVLTSSMSAMQFNDCGANDNAAQTVDDANTFAWETLATFILVATVHATAVYKPGAGPTAPFAIGLAIAATCGIDGSFTGGFGNPARFFAPMVVNRCLRDKSHLYLIGQFLGGAAAGLIWGLGFAMFKSSPGAASSEMTHESNPVENQKGAVPTQSAHPKPTGHANEDETL